MSRVFASTLVSHFSSSIVLRLIYFNIIFYVKCSGSQINFLILFHEVIHEIVFSFVYYYNNNYFFAKGCFLFFLFYWKRARSTIHTKFKSQKARFIHSQPPSPTPATLRPVTNSGDGNDRTIGTVWRMATDLAVHSGNTNNFRRNRSGGTWFWQHERFLSGL